MDRLDVLLVSRISEDNLFGMKSFLQRRLLDNIHPEITYAFFNSAPTSDKDCTSSLSISLTEEASLGMNERTEILYCVLQNFVSQLHLYLFGTMRIATVRYVSCNCIIYTYDCSKFIPEVDGL